MPGIDIHRRRHQNVLPMVRTTRLYGCVMGSGQLSCITLCSLQSIGSAGRIRHGPIQVSSTGSCLSSIRHRCIAGIILKKYYLNQLTSSYSSSRPSLIVSSGIWPFYCAICPYAGHYSFSPPNASKKGKACSRVYQVLERINQRTTCN